MFRFFAGCCVCVFAIFLVIDVDCKRRSVGRWKNWIDMTLCSGSSCNCTGEIDNETECAVGFVIQIRICRPAPDGGWCVPDAAGHGSIRNSTCVNPESTCPGWGEWSPWGKCQCGLAEATRSRKCDNPRPRNTSDHCIGEEKDFRDCVCNVTEATTAEPDYYESTTAVDESVTLLPCCLPGQMRGLGDFEESENDDYAYAYYYDYCRRCDEGYNSTLFAGANETESAID